MRLHRLTLVPRSPWRTPWQADTLVGALCAVAARTRGPEFLRSRLIDPMLAGTPPFVLSDAFPGDLLPIPASLRLADWPGGTNLKAIKRARWLRVDDFFAVRAGGIPLPDRLVAESTVVGIEARHHNTLGRDSDASLEEGGLFSRPDTRLLAASGGDGVLTLYFRVQDKEAIGLLLDLLEELSLTGFGADAATGRGQFDLAGEPSPAPQVEEAPPGANGVVVLSTFQPAPGNPTDGLWEAFAKFGKLGPDLGLADVRKHTLIMFRPGACFRADPATPFLGRAVPMDLVLSAPSAQDLRARGINIVHPAFGLAVPATLSEEVVP